jgi:hypothetical protein
MNRRFLALLACLLVATSCVTAIDVQRVEDVPQNPRIPREGCAVFQGLAPTCEPAALSTWTSRPAAGATIAMNKVTSSPAVLLQQHGMRSPCRSRTTDSMCRPDLPHPRIVRC